MDQVVHGQERDGDRQAPGLRTPRSPCSTAARRRLSVLHGRESEAYTKHRKTGKVEGNPADSGSRVYYLVTLRKSSQGVWQNASVRSERGECAK
ncbi:hypothetical protein LV779_13235 [Streptomyces thinghirensis]|nr:hypothetical protein [Streptomyces thinghirensis]